MQAAGLIILFQAMQAAGLIILFLHNSHYNVFPIRLAFGICICQQARVLISRRRETKRNDAIYLKRSFILAKLMVHLQLRKDEGENAGETEDAKVSHHTGSVSLAIHEVFESHRDSAPTPNQLILISHFSDCIVFRKPAISEKPLRLRPTTEKNKIN